MGAVDECPSPLLRGGAAPEGASLLTPLRQGIPRDTHPRPHPQLREMRTMSSRGTTLMRSRTAPPGSSP